jgi:anti-sigma factor RsiW
VDCHETGRLIDPFVDDELGVADAAALREHLHTCTGCARLVADREALRRLLQRIPYHTAPPRVRALAARHQQQQHRARTARVMLARAAAVVLAISVGGGLWARWFQARREAAALAEAFVNRHIDALASERLFAVRSSDQHTVKPWFLGKLDFTPPVTDLAADGFPLAGGRIEEVGGQRAAVLVYMRRQHPISVFIWPEGRDRARAGFESIRGFHVRHWTAQAMSFWAVSDLNDAELNAFADDLGRSADRR